jgi:hypothetical protein
MIALLSSKEQRTPRHPPPTIASRRNEYGPHYFGGLAATNRHVPILSPEEMKHVQETLLQGTFLVQELLQTVTVEA